MYFKKLKEIWEQVYNPETNINDVIEKYFHPEYKQCINDETLDREQYLSHVEEQRKGMNITSIDYKTFLEKEDKLFAIYYPKGVDTNNQAIEAEVIAYFHFKNQKIIYTHGQVRFISGNAESADM
jgi:hypothetical protein